MPLRFIKASLCILVLTLAGAAGMGTGCSAQGEGERCTFFAGSNDADINGNSECQAGLYCKQAFNITLYPYDRCCPMNLQDPSNVPACYAPNMVGGTPDASIGESGPTDAPLETTVDAKVKDAPKGDAPADHKTDAPPSDGAGG